MKAFFSAVEKKLSLKGRICSGWNRAYGCAFKDSEGIELGGITSTWAMATSVADGVYIIQIQADHVVELRKVLLLK